MRNSRYLCVIWIKKFFCVRKFLLGLSDEFLKYHTPLARAILSTYHQTAMRCVLERAPLCGHSDMRDPTQITTDIAALRVYGRWVLLLHARSPKNGAIYKKRRN